MPWTEAFERWALLGTEFCADFPFLDRVAIQRFRGDYHALTEYLANTHDLTLAEAADALEDWLAFRATALVRATA